MSTFLLLESLIFIIHFWLIRGYISMIIQYRANRSKRKKISKGQDFFEWLFYKRYRKYIPKKYFLWYCLNFVVYVLIVVLVIVLIKLGVSRNIWGKVGYAYLIIPSFPYIIINFLWYDKNTRDLNPGKTMKKTGDGSPS